MAWFDDAVVVNQIKEVVDATGPCPWCDDGGKPLVVTNFESRVTYRVVCEKCMGAGPISSTNKVFAVELWNRAGQHWKPISTLSPEHDTVNVLLLHRSGRITFGPGSYGRTVSVLDSLRLAGRPVDAAIEWMPVPEK